MAQKNRSRNFERGIEEISKGKDLASSQEYNDNRGKNNFRYESSNSKSKNENFSNLKKNSWRNKNNQKFHDRDFKEQKESEPEFVKSGPGSLGAMSELARKNLSEALNKKVESVVSISKKEDGWAVELEVIDEEYLPEIELKSMSDIIGVYEIQLDDKGELISWNKKHSRKRGEIK